MSTDKVDPSKKDAKISPADDLVKTSKKGDVELSEEELTNVSGGTGIITQRKAGKGQQEF